MKPKLLTLDDATQIETLEQAEQTHPWSSHVIHSCFGARYINLGLFDEHRLIAYIISDCVAGEANIMNVCVASEYRRQGLAEQLFEALFEQLKVQSVDTIWLEVRASNRAAINLYDKLGFNQISVRPNYYPTPQGNEDALLMSLMLF